MSNYTKTTDFASKDTLNSGDPNKIVRGTEFDTEFNNIATASATKADLNNPSFEGNVSVNGDITVPSNATIDGRDVSADGTKLDTIETSADVTDTTNVTAAGAVMDSELTDEAAVKALDQGVATTDSPTFAGATLGAVTYAATDGTDGQVLTTDGAGNATFEALPDSLYLNVTDFGATGDGTTDDTTFIQNAINHASKNKIQTIFFPDGHYKYTTLRLYHDATDNPNFQGSSASYTGDGLDTTFDYDWYIKSASDLIVKVDGVQKILDTDYTVSGVGSDAGGTVTFTSAPGSSLSISIAGPNRDGRFVFLGTGRIAITDLRTYDGTSSTEGRLYGSVLESTSGGGGIIIDPTAAFDSKDARNFLGEKMTFIANNTTQIIEAKACPGLSFEFCSFKQLNNDGDGIIAQNAWFFTFTNCFLIGPDKDNATGTGIIGGTDFFAGQWNINQSLVDTWRDCVSWEKGEFVNVSFRDSAIQNANRYAIHGSGGVINQLLLDNTYFENVGVTGTSFVYGASNVIRNLVMQSNFILCGNNSGTSRITGPSVDLVNCDSFSLSGSYVYRMYTPVVRVGNTRNFTDISGRVENNFFRNDATIPRAYSGDNDRTEFGVPFTTASSVLTVTVDGVTKTLGVDYTVSGLGDIAGAVVTFTTAPSSGAAISIDATNLETYFLFEGKLPEFKNNIWTGFTSGLYDSGSIFKLFDDTSDYALNYQDGLYGVNSFTRLGLGDISVETGIASSPKGIAAGSDKTYYDLTHTVAGGLALTIPNNTGTSPNTKNNVPHGRMFIIKNNSASSDFIIVRNRSDFSTIQRLQRGMTGIFVLDAKGTGKFNLAGVFGGDDPIYDTVTALNSITVNEVTFDGTDGTSGQFLTTDGSGNLSFATATGVGINAVVDDTTPQLGGDLDLNGSDITGTGNLDFTGTINTVLSVDGTTEDVFITGAVPGLELVESDNGGSRVRYAVENSEIFQSLYGADTSTFGSITQQTRLSDGTSNQVIYTYDAGTNDYHWWGTRAGGDRLVQIDSNGKFRVRGGDVSFFNDGVTSEAFFWDASTSRLGLGTTDPISDLEIEGVDRTLRLTDTGSNSSFIKLETDNFNPEIVVQRQGSNPSYIKMVAFGNEARLEMNNLAGKLSKIITDGGGSMEFETDSVRRMNILSTGDILSYADDGTTEGMRWDASTSRLGIGTPSPDYLLNLEGSEATILIDNTAGLPDQPLLIFQADMGTNDRNFQIKSPATDSASAPFRFVTGNSFAFEIDSTTDAFVIDSNANVGIGTDSPDAGLDIAAAVSGVNLKLTNTTAEAAGATQYNANMKTAYASEAFTLYAGDVYRDLAWLGFDKFGKEITFGTGTPDGSVNQRMVIDSSGNLLVGTSASRTGNYSISLEPNNSLMYFRAAGTGSLQQAIFVRDTTGTPVSVGSIATTGTSTAYNISSDQRLKDNIVDAPSASNDIDAIQVRSFDWKADGSHQKYGMVAQELQTVAPDAVTEGDTEEDMMGVDYSKLVPMLVKEIQSLRARVAQLEND